MLRTCGVVSVATVTGASDWTVNPGAPMVIGHAVCRREAAGSIRKSLERSSWTDVNIAHTHTLTHTHLHTHSSFLSCLGRSQHLHPSLSFIISVTLFHSVFSSHRERGGEGAGGRERDRGRGTGGEGERERGREIQPPLLHLGLQSRNRGSQLITAESSECLSSDAPLTNHSSLCSSFLLQRVRAD